MDTEGTHEAFRTDASFLHELDSPMNSREGLVVILSRRTRSRSEQKRAEERVAAGLCTMKHQIPNSTSDDLVDCNAPTIVNGRSIGTRGCCARCYQSFTNYLGSMPPDQAAAAEQEAIARGWILGEQEIRKMKTRFAFARLLKRDAS